MSGRDINNIIEIMKKDFKASFSNPIVVLILVAIIILPSLYALLNIQACWDPYENTNSVEFAIANLDKGASFHDEKINVGNELVSELKDNDKFKWVFVTEEELRDGVHSGKYYAGMILPKDLSKDVVSISSDHPKSAKIEYIVNIKSNPVASKLTDNAANAVYKTMNAKIVAFINVAAYGKLGELQSGLSSGASQLSSGASQLSDGANQVSSGADAVSSGAKDLDHGGKKVTNGADKVKSSTGKINKGAKKVSNSAKDIETGSSKVQQGAKDLESSVDPSLLPGPIQTVVNGSLSLAEASSQLAGGSSSLAQGSVKLASGSSKLANGAGDVASGANDVVGGSDKLAKGALSLAAGSQLLSSSAAQALFSAASALSGASTSLSDVTGINETQLGKYIYSPTKLEREELYPTSNYGSSVAPFYIVLSMWVGAVITCVMIKPGTSTKTKYSPLEMYFGKLLLFVIMAILQAMVTISGAFILGIDIDNPLMFIFSATLVSVIFMVLIYSLISALGQVGKGIGVILLVLQISGTGGIYPIEIMGILFKGLYPFMPMTYAITMIRESLLGIFWSNYIPSLLVLIGIGLATIILAVIIKEKADNASHYFEERLEESGLF
ncbi:MAG: YhgE/Pip domain-containing protein [Methanobrevibacter thaueri]|nr:YhgE/Pip domain-containing protein [Methanobrevibacter thaueri]